MDDKLLKIRRIRVLEQLLRDCRTVIRNAKSDGLCNDPEWGELLERIDELL